MGFLPHTINKVTPSSIKSSNAYVKIKNRKEESKSYEIVFHRRGDRNDYAHMKNINLG